MEDTVCEFTKSLLARARAREDLLALETTKLRSVITSAVTPSVTQEIPQATQDSVSPTTTPSDIDIDIEMDTTGGTKHEEQSEEEEEIPMENEIQQIKGRELTLNSAPVMSASPLSRKSRLTSLATTINNWEDDLKTKTDYKQTTVGVNKSPVKKQTFVVNKEIRGVNNSLVKKQAPQPPFVVNKEIAVGGAESPVKKLAPQPPSVANKEIPVEIGTESPGKKQAPLPPKVITSTVKPKPLFQKNETSLFVKEPKSIECSFLNSSSNKRKSTDPSELSVAQKARLFDNQSGAVNFNKNKVVPSPSPLRKFDAIKKTFEPKKTFYFGEILSEQSEPQPQPTEYKKMKSEITKEKKEEGISPVVESKPTKEEEKNEIVEEEENDMDVDISLSDSINSGNNDKILSSTVIEGQGSPSKSFEIASSIKPIKIRKSLQGELLYPSLTDIDIETDLDSSAENNEISTNFAIDQIDKFIDEALEGQDDYLDETRPVNTTVLENTQVASGTRSDTASVSVLEPPQQQKLTHSISVYRKKQEQLKVIPTFEERMIKEDEEDEGEKIDVCKETLARLEQQVLIQQKSIAQASKAIDVCGNNFSSSEYIEAERVLLIAVHRRKQLLNYITELKNPSSKKQELLILPCQQAPCSLSTLKIGRIKLSQSRAHHGSNSSVNIIALFKYNENVLVSKYGKNGEFAEEFLFKDVKPNFKVVMEVYCLEVNPQSQKEMTPSKKTLTMKMFHTPTKSTKKYNETHSLPTVRTPSFKLQGSLTIDLSNVKNRAFNLTLVSNRGYLQPPVTMDIECENNENSVKIEGFLTVFSDVNGLGAWHRRYAAMDGDYEVKFWAYPEDRFASTKPPLMKINLKSCITPRVAPAPRDVCARQNTFLLLTSRKPEPDDKDGLVLSVREDYTAVKHLISADNRPERDDWIEKLNAALVNLRAWGNNHNV